MGPYIKAAFVAGFLAVGFYTGWQYAKDYFYPGGDTSPHLNLDLMETKGIPDFALKRLDGSEFKMSETRGKAVLLNFWASWCDPCVAEFPSLLKLIERFKGELILVAVSADEEQTDIETFMKAFKADSPWLEVLRDPKREVIEKMFGTKVLPESYVIDTKGKLVRKIVGVEDWHNVYSIQFFESVIGKYKK